MSYYAYIVALVINPPSIAFPYVPPHFPVLCRPCPVARLVILYVFFGSRD
jgi:hypothetical protein